MLFAAIDPPLRRTLVDPAAKATPLASVNVPPHVFVVVLLNNCIPTGKLSVSVVKFNVVALGLVIRIDTGTAVPEAKDVIVAPKAPKVFSTPGKPTERVAVAAKVLLPILVVVNPPTGIKFT